MAVSTARRQARLLCGPAVATLLLLLACSIPPAAATGRQLLASSLPVYDLVEYIGTSPTGLPITVDDINTFPAAPDNVRLTWVIAFIGDATGTQTPSGNFACIGGNFCEGDDLNQDLITALRSVKAGVGVTVLGGLGGSKYPQWPDSTSSDYADTAAASLIAYAKTNNLDGYDLDFENVNDDWISKWTSIVQQLREADLIVTLDTFGTDTSGTVGDYGTLYKNLQPKSGAKIKVDGVNYQAYALDSSDTADESYVKSTISDVVDTFGISGHERQRTVFGVAPDRPGGDAGYKLNCAALERIKDIVCPALYQGSDDTDNTHWAAGIMVFDFDTELIGGGFTLVNAAYQALSGQCSSIDKC